MADISINKFTSVVKLQGNSASVPSLPPSLEDTPPAVNPPGTGVSPSVSTFLQLTDTPALYTGQGAKAVSVKSDETGLEFVDFPTVTGGDEPAVKTTASSDQTLPSGVLTILDYDDTLTNNATLIYSVGTDGRITVSDNGVFDITAGVVIEADALTALESAFLGIFRNGNLVAISSINTTIAAGASSGLSCSTQIALLSGDIIDCRALVTSVGGVAPGLARRLGTLLGANATQVNSLAIVKCISNGQSFLQLSDTPSTYSGQAGLFPKVNSGETGLEFFNPLSLPLTGYTVGSNTALADTDTILGAFGKVQGQINAKIGGTIASGQVALGTGVNIVGGSANFTFNSTFAILSLGTVVNPWNTFTGGVQASRGSFVGNTSELDLSHNAFYESAWKYIANGFATNYFQTGGSYYWRTAPSGLAGDNITFTQRMRLTQEGQLWIGTNAGTNTLDVNGTARIRTISNLGTSATEVLVPSATGVLSKRTLAELASDGNLMTGTLTSGYLPKATGTNNLANSLVFEDADGIGINTTNPRRKFHVNSDNFGDHIILERLGSFGFITVGINDTILLGANDSRISPSGDTLLSVLKGGNVGIKTIDPTEALDVNGQVRVRTINNLGTSANEILVQDATGVIHKRTASELSSDIGASVETSGTFTPSLIDSGSGATYSFSSSGYYIKIGSFVVVRVNFTISSTTGTPTGQLQITGLPFSATSGIGNGTIRTFTGSGLSVDNLNLLVPQPQTSNIRFAIKNAINFLNAMTLSSGSTIDITVTYW